MDGKNDKQIRIRVSADLLDRWNALHKAQATNGSEVLRRSMEAYIQEHTTQVSASIAEESHD